MEGERSIIERAMAGVVVVACERCDGNGEIGEPTLRIRCPECRGSKQTTINELEVGREAGT